MYFYSALAQHYHHFLLIQCPPLLTLKSSPTANTGHHPAWHLSKELQVYDFRLLKSNNASRYFYRSKKRARAALVKASITAFPVPLASLLQGQKMERVRCGKTEQLFTLPVRSYQIAFLSCQQNKLSPNRTFNSTLSERQAHFISKKEQSSCHKTK